MKLNSVFLSILFVVSLSINTIAQELYAINVVWDDSFAEWSFITADEKEGRFSKRWINREDWTEWTFSFDELHGRVKMKWQDNPNHWELSYGGSVVNVVTRWRNDITEWRISKGPIKLTIKSRYTNNLDEWILVGDRYGSFSLKTEWDNDPRDWHIYDELDQKITMDMKLAMCFISIISSAPRF